ncbi:MAG: hypothetical protein ACI4F7_10635, partial [Acutalibacteraceae bacterium]
FTPDQVTNGDGADWGLPSGHKTLIDIDGKKYVKVETSTGGRVIFPALDFSNRDWTGIKYIDMEIINNSSSPINMFPYIFVDDSTPFCLSAGNSVQLIVGENVKNQVLTSIYVSIPENFSGVLRIPVDDSGSQYIHLWGTEAFDITKMSNVCFELAEGGDISFGNVTLRYAVEEDKEEEEKDTSKKIVFDPEEYSAEQIADGNNIDWGLPNGGKKEHSKIGDKTYIKIMSVDAGKAVFPSFAVANYDWSGSKALDIEVANTSDVPQKLAPYYFINETTPMVQKPLVTVTLIWEDGSSIKQTTRENYIVIPARFKGSVRLDVKEDGSDTVPLWGEPYFDIKKITRICFTVPKQTTVYVGKMILYYDVPAVNVNAGRATCIAAQTPDDISECVNTVWGILTGEMKAVVKGGKDYIKIKVNNIRGGEAPSKAVFQPFDSSIQNMSGKKSIQIPIVNESGAAITISPFIYINDETPFELKNGTKVILNGKSVSVSAGGITLPAGFSGTLSIPLDNKGGNYQRMWGSGSFDITHVSRLGMNFRQNGCISVGDIEIR